MQLFLFWVNYFRFFFFSCERWKKKFFHRFRKFRVPSGVSVSGMKEFRIACKIIHIIIMCHQVKPWMTKNRWWSRCIRIFHRGREWPELFFHFGFPRCESEILKNWLHQFNLLRIHGGYGDQYYTRMRNTNWNLTERKNIDFNSIHWNGFFFFSCIYNCVVSLGAVNLRLSIFGVFRFISDSYGR